jgi:hypothetical protein
MESRDLNTTHHIKITALYTILEICRKLYSAGKVKWRYFTRIITA